MAEFKKLNPTTITVTSPLKGEINISNLIWFLKLSDYPVVPKKTSSKKKISFPILENKDIVSACYENFYRGCLKRNKCFKNSVTCDITISSNRDSAANGVKKNVITKIYKETIHFVGVKFIENFEPIFTSVVQIINDLNRKIRFDGTEGPNLLKICQILDDACATQSQKLPLELLLSLQNLVPIMDETLHNWLQIETVENIKLFSLFLSCLGHKSPEDLRDFRICTENLDYTNFNIAMINFNYNLGFKIDLDNLCRYIKALPETSFVISYDNMMDHSGKITSAYKRTNDTKIRKKNKKTKHTFIVYKSGIVTQSGPGGEVMEDIYNKFIQLIKDSRTVIENKFK